MRRESWVRYNWRPAMGWVYVAVCLFDFIIAPILWTAGQGYIITYAEDPKTAIVSQQWSPLTLQGSGLFHVAMGGFLGVTSWGRTREKLQGVAGMGFRLN